MDTAKVDIRKLQLLNDRINQCIDALNQVRLSVHGLSHASAVGQGAPFGQAPFGAVPFGTGYAAGYGTAGIPGLGQGLPQGPIAGGAVPYGYGGIGVNPYLGLSHTSAEGAWADPTRQVVADPFLMARIAQTFPNAYQGTGL